MRSLGIENPRYASWIVECYGRGTSQRKKANPAFTQWRKNLFHSTVSKCLVVWQVPSIRMKNLPPKGFKVNTKDNQGMQQCGLDFWQQPPVPNGWWESAKHSGISKTYHSHSTSRPGRPGVLGCRDRFHVLGTWVEKQPFKSSYQSLSFNCDSLFFTKPYKMPFCLRC